MCLIIDANLASVVFTQTNDIAYQRLRDIIFSTNRLKLVYGGKLTVKYSNIKNVLPVIALLSQSGKAIKIANDLIDAQLPTARTLCTSNDAHVIALARANRNLAHLLCTDDQALRKDFQNKALIDNPRGKIYSPTRHKQSLANC